MSNLLPARIRAVVVAFATAFATALLGGCETLGAPAARGTDEAAVSASQPPQQQAPAQSSGPASAGTSADASAPAQTSAQTSAQSPTQGAQQAPAPVAASSQGLKPFAEVVKDAKQLPGLLTLWQKEEKLWIEIGPDQFDRPFFLAINLSRGLGEKRLHAGTMGSWDTAGDAFVAEFRRIGPQVQLVAKNTRFTARPGSAEETAVRRAFSDSLLASATVASQPHPERHSVLIEANALLLVDVGRGAAAIERAYRNTYAFDARHSYFASARSTPEQTSIDVTAHYTQARIPLPPATPGTTYFPPPDVIEDPRSLFLGFLYSFTPLPANPMPARAADPRLGHFRTARLDFSDERRVEPYRFYVQRWRLEKQDASAELSAPVKPITFWLDREIPEKYRAPIRAGILEWNRAFERIGFRDAIRVVDQPADADFDTGDTVHASVRWMTTARPSYGAIGPRHVDPRSGEILDADIGIDANMTRNVRFIRREVVGEARGRMYDDNGDPDPAALGIDLAAGRACGYSTLAAREYGFALAMLEARGEIDPEGPEAESFVAEYLKDTTMHEVGHALGLMHNFRASTTYTAAQLADPEFTGKNGIAGSVMDYHPFNLAAKGEKQGAYGMHTIGPYDYWAIEYAYRPLAPGRESEELAAIASRSSEPLLAYASDYDVFEGLDPEVNQLDLGTDTLAYYRKRLALTHELWERLEKRTLAPGESYNVLRRRFMTGFTQIGHAMGLAAKYVGGATVVRDYAGTSRAPISPVAPARQREALALIAEGLFRTDSFRVPPEFLRRLADNPLERETEWAVRPLGSVVALPDMVLNVQRDVLGRLLGPTVAQRLLANQSSLADRGDALSLAELYETVQNAVWSEAAAGSEVDLLRRNLQREHLRRVAGALLAPNPIMPADARALHRLNAHRLVAQLSRAVKAPGLSVETRAHYAESLETLNDALKAPFTRSGA